MRPYSIVIYLGVFILLFSQVNPVFSQKADSKLNEKISQSIRIKGTVLNQQNDPIFHAAAVVPGASTGTLTNAEGQFVIIAPTLPLTLRITAIGCKSLDTTILMDHTTLTSGVKYADFNNITVIESDKEEIKKSSNENFGIPILINEKLLLGKFEDLPLDTTYKLDVQLNCELPATSATNFKLETIKHRILTVEPVMSSPLNTVEGTYLYLNRDYGRLDPF